MLHCPILIKIVYSHCFPNVFCMPFIMIGQVPENLGFGYYTRKLSYIPSFSLKFFAILYDDFSKWTLIYWRYCCRILKNHQILYNFRYNNEGEKLYITIINRGPNWGNHEFRVLETHHNPSIFTISPKNDNLLFCSKGHIIQFQCCELMFLTTTLNSEEFTSTIFVKQKGRVIIWKQKIYFKAYILYYTKYSTYILISLPRSFRLLCSRTLLVGIYHKKKSR